MFPPLFMRFHRDRQLGHMNRRIIMGAVPHIVLDRRIITGAVNHIISDGLQCATLAVEEVRRCRWEGHRERVLKTFQWDHRVRDRGLICRCILIGMKVRRGGNSCMNENRGNDLAAFGGAVKFHTSRANAQQNERPRECAIIFRDLVRKLTVLEIECEKCGSSKICPRSTCETPLAPWKRLDDVQASLPAKDRARVEREGNLLSRAQYEKCLNDVARHPPAFPEVLAPAVGALI